MDSPFLGPTYDLNSRPASVQRTINLMPVPIEPGNERTSWVFKDVPGLVPFERPACTGCMTWGSVVLANTILVADSHQAISYGNGRFVLVGRRGSPSLAAAQYSTNGGVSWNLASTPPNFGSGVAMLMAQWGDTEGLFVGISFTEPAFYATSPDGDVWTLRAKPSSSWYCISRVGGRFIVTVSSVSTVNYRSAADGLSFALNGAFPVAAQWREFADNGTVIVGSGFDGAIARSARSTDGGVTWSAGGNMPAAADYFRMVYGNGVFVAFSPGAGLNYVATSTDGVSWTAGTLPPSRLIGYVSLIFDGTAFYLLGEWQEVLRSVDGLTWTICPGLLPSVQRWLGSTDGDGRYVAFDADSSLNTNAAQGSC